MSNYVKVFNGAAKDAEATPLSPSEWDGEYSAIATSIATKVDDIAGGTEDNFVLLDAQGDPYDSGLAVDNFVNISAPVQTALNAIPNAPAPVSTQMVRAGTGQFFNGYTETGDLDSQTDQLTLTENAFAKAGPSGDPVYPTQALDTMLNVWQGGAGLVLFKHTVNFHSLTSDTNTYRLYAAKTNPVTAVESDLKIFTESHAWDSTSRDTTFVGYFWVEVDADGAFYMAWLDDGTGTMSTHYLQAIASFQT